MFLLLLVACLQPIDDSPTGVFEYVWTDFDERYGGFDDRDVDWDAVYDTFQPRVHDAMGDDELYDVLGSMIATLDDGHVRMIAPGREMLESNHVYRDDTIEGTFDADLVAQAYLGGDVDTGPWDWYAYGMAGDRIPYLWLPGIDDNTYVIDTIADENPDAKAFIIDMRHSGGGSFTYALKGMGRLTETDIPVWRSRSRNGPEQDDFDEWMTWELEARKPYWDVPIILLSDAVTISASERMIMALQELPDVLTIGTRTNGAQATTILRQAPNGWNYQLPVQEVEAVDGTVYEGIGTPVDIELSNDPEDVAGGIDTVLERALEIAGEMP